MVVSKNGFDLIKQFEGCNLNAYPDPATGNLPVTIGFGSVMYKTGDKIKMGDTITQEQAEDLLEWEVNQKGSILSSLNLGLNQNQFDAVVSFIYNVGFGNFNKSTMFKRLKAGDYEVANEFGKWNKANSKIMKGLTTRRAAEATLFNTPM